PRPSRPAVHSCTVDPVTLDGSSRTVTRPLVVGFGRVGVAMTGLGAEAPDPTSGAVADLAELDLAPAPGIAVAACTAVSLGCRARLVGSIGSDALGGVARAMISRAGVDVEHLRPMGRSQVRVRLVDPRGAH